MQVQNFDWGRGRSFFVQACALLGGTAVDAVIFDSLELDVLISRITVSWSA